MRSTVVFVMIAMLVGGVPGVSAETPCEELRVRVTTPEPTQKFTYGPIRSQLDAMAMGPHTSHRVAGTPLHQPGQWLRSPANTTRLAALSQDLGHHDTALFTQSGTPSGLTSTGKKVLIVAAVVIVVTLVVVKLSCDPDDFLAYC